MGRILSTDEMLETKMPTVSRALLRQMDFRGDGPPRIRLSPRRFVYDEEAVDRWLASRVEQPRRSA